MNNITKFTIVAASTLGTGALVKRLWKQKYSEEKQRGNRSEKMLQLYYHWLLLKQKNIGLDTFFVNKGIKEIAVLDLAPQGRRLIDELTESAVSVRYAIERDNPAAIHERLEVLRLHDDPLPAVDAVVICSLRDYQVLTKELREELNSECPVFALETVILKTLEMNMFHPRDGVMNPLNLSVSD